MTSSYQPRNRKRKRRKGSLSPLGIIVAVLALVAIILATIFVVKKIKGNDATTETLEPESELSQHVSIDGVNVTGKGRTEAKNELLKKYNWKMTVRCQGADPSTYEVTNLVEDSIDNTLDLVYKSINPEESYTIVFEIDEKRLAENLAAMKALWNVDPVNGTIAGFDKETETFTYSDSIDGKVFDAAAVEAEIRNAVASKKFDTAITTKLETVAAEFDQEEAKANYKTIGYYQTKSTSNADRNSNLNLACKAIDGTLLQVGEQFSFNTLTGNRTAEKGYKAAAAYQNGEVVQEPGGGVCQVASTLYNAMVFAGLTADERHAHTYAPTYVTPGEDATVSYDGFSGPDLKFTNTSSAAIVVRAKYESQTVTCWIVGIPILAEGETIELYSWKNEGSDTTPTPIYEEDPTLAPGEEVVDSQGDLGSTWTTNIIRKKDGVIINQKDDNSQPGEFFHTSKYNGHKPKIRRNSGATQLMPATDEAGNIIYELNEDGETVPIMVPYEAPETVESAEGEIGPGTGNGPGVNADPQPKESQDPDSAQQTAPAPGNIDIVDMPQVERVPEAPGA